MFQTTPNHSGQSQMAALLDCLAQSSSRPRYAFMVLSLIAEVAKPTGEAGPFVQRSGQTLTLRDYLCDSLMPMGARDPRRLAITAKVRSDLVGEKRLPTDESEAAALIEQEVRQRVRSSGKTNLSRAVSELVKAGLLGRYYKGFVVDHVNRGGQRHAVYILQGRARCLIANRGPVQPSLPGLFAEVLQRV